MAERGRAPERQLATLRGAAAAGETRGLQRTLSDLSGQLRDDTHYRGEILVLEERMRVVAETGSRLVRRLRASDPEVSSEA